MDPGAQDRLPRYFLAADDFGAFQVNEAVLLGRLFPLRADMNPQRVAADLREFQRAGILVIWADTDGKRWAEFPNWFKHQRPPRAGTKRKTPERPAGVPLESAADRSGPLEGAADGGNPLESAADSGIDPAGQAAGIRSGFPASAGSRANPLPYSQAQAQSCVVSAVAGAVGPAADAAAGGLPAPDAPPSDALLAAFRRSLAEALCIAGANPLRLAKPQLAAGIRRDLARLGMEHAVELCAERAKDTGTVPRTLDYFADLLAEAEIPRPTRKPGEPPKPSDPDFNDPAAWPSMQAFYDRDSRAA